MKVLLNVNLSALELDKEGYILPYVRDLLMEIVWRGQHSVDEELLDLYHEQITDDYNGDTEEADNALTILSPLKSNMANGDYGIEVVDFIQAFEGRSDEIKEVEILKDQHPNYVLMVTTEETDVNVNQSEPIRFK